MGTRLLLLVFLFIDKDYAQDNPIILNTDIQGLAGKLYPIKK